MKRTAISLALVMAALAIIGCGQANKPMSGMQSGTGMMQNTGAGHNGYGAAIPADMGVTPISQIAATPAAFEGKDVVVTGKITSECPSGGWVWLKDASGEIYVNMHPTGIAIPQRVGKTVKAMGKVVLEEGRPQVVGTGVELQ